MSDLNYVTYGSGPPIVLVHGLAGSTRWWRRNVQALSRRFTVYLLDLPGFGLSTSAQPLEQIVESLPIWLDWIGLDRTRIVGHSMGGYVALHLAATEPERVEKLALIDSVGIPLDSSLRGMFSRLWRASNHGSRTFVPTVITDGLRAGFPTLLRLTLEIMEVDGRPLLERVQAPTLVLWGTRDQILPPKMGVEMARLLPEGRLKLVPHAGHNAMADQPTVVNRHLLDFFRPERRLTEQSSQTRRAS